jgi:hypothetical protein
VIAGNSDLTVAEVQLMKMTQRERRLANALKQVHASANRILRGTQVRNTLSTKYSTNCSETSFVNRLRLSNIVRRIPSKYKSGFAVSRIFRNVSINAESKGWCR